jgi:hypothetical protein
MERSVDVARLMLLNVALQDGVSAVGRSLRFSFRVVCHDRSHLFEHRVFELSYRCS